MFELAISRDYIVNWRRWNKIQKKATFWVEIWLDNQLKFTAHVKERLTKAKIVKI